MVMINPLNFMIASVFPLTDSINKTAVRCKCICYLYCKELFIYIVLISNIEKIYNYFTYCLHMYWNISRPIEVSIHRVKKD